MGLPSAVWLPLTISGLQSLLACVFFARGFTREGLQRLTDASSWLPHEFSVTDDGDVFVLSLACAMAASSAALLCYGCAPCCVRTGRRVVLAYAIAVLFGALAAYPLAKVSVAPQVDGWAWSSALTLFCCATLDAFVLARSTLGSVYAWAISVTAARFLGRGWQAAAAREVAAGRAATKAAAAAAGATAAESGAAPRKPQRGLLRLLSLSRPDWHLVTAAFACLTIAAIASTILPQLVGNTIDAAIDNDEDSFNTMVTWLVIVSLVTAIFSGLRGLCFNIALARLRCRLRDRLFRALVTQELVRVVSPQLH